MAISVVESFKYETANSGTGPVTFGTTVQPMQPGDVVVLIATFFSTAEMSPPYGLGGSWSSYYSLMDTMGPSSGASSMPSMTMHVCRDATGPGAIQTNMSTALRGAVYGFVLRSSTGGFVSLFRNVVGTSSAAYTSLSQTATRARAGDLAIGVASWSPATGNPTTSLSPAATTTLPFYDNLSYNEIQAMWRVVTGDEDVSITSTRANASRGSASILVVTDDAQSPPVPEVIPLSVTDVAASWGAFADAFEFMPSDLIVVLEDRTLSANPGDTTPSGLGATWTKTMLEPGSQPDRPRRAVMHVGRGATTPGLITMSSPDFALNSGLVEVLVVRGAQSGIVKHEGTVVDASGTAHTGVQIQANAGELVLAHMYRGSASGSATDLLAVETPATGWATTLPKGTIPGQIWASYRRATADGETHQAGYTSSASVTSTVSTLRFGTLADNLLVTIDATADLQVTLTKALAATLDTVSDLAVTLARPIVVTLDASSDLSMTTRRSLAETLDAVSDLTATFTLMSYTAQVLADNPVAYWRLGDGPTTMSDSSGNGRHGTYLTHTPALGLVRGDVDGANAGTAIVPAPSPLSGAFEFTLEFILSTTSGSDFESYAILAIGEEWDRFVLGVSMFNGSLQVSMQMADGQIVNISPSGDTVLNDGAPHHVAVRFGSMAYYGGDPNQRQFELFIDGSEGGQQWMTEDALTVRSLPAAPLYLGRDRDRTQRDEDEFIGTSSDFEGVLDEVAIYDYPVPYERLISHAEALGETYVLRSTSDLEVILGRLRFDLDSTSDLLVALTRSMAETLSSSSDLLATFVLARQLEAQTLAATSDLLVTMSLPAAGSQVQRWLLRDTATGVEWRMPINPDSMSSPLPRRQMKFGRGWRRDGRVRTFMGPSEAVEWEWSGVIRSKDHYDQLVEWAHRSVAVDVTDHLGRTFRVFITEFNPTDRKPTPRVQWRLRYAMKARILERVS